MDKPDADTPSGETTEALDRKEMPKYQEMKHPQETTKSNLYKNATPTEKEEPILGLDPSNKDNQTKIPLKTID